MCIQLEDLELLQRHKHPLTFHLEIETGMNRLGISTDMMMDVARFLSSFPHYMEGVFTHWVESEIKKSHLLLSRISFSMKLSPCWPPSAEDHLSPTWTTVVEFSTTRVMASGYARAFHCMAIALTQIQLETQARDVLENQHHADQTFEQGDSVSYNRSFQAKKRMTIATLPSDTGMALPETTRHACGI
ncbi:MAG: alanine racemase [Bdellovibrionota bacterium]